jgi:RNA polymerase sigma-70 factor (ECF subfamily)
MLAICLALVETQEQKSLFENIYYDYRKQMFVAARRILEDDGLTEDALQNAFLGIAKQIKKTQTFSQEETRAYVLAVAKNAAIKIAKTEQKIIDNQVSFDAIEATLGNNDPSTQTIHKDSLRVLISIIRELPGDYRDLLMFRYVHDMKYTEIATAIGEKSGTIRMRMNRARAMLKSRCREEGITIEN